MAALYEAIKLESVSNKSGTQTGNTTSPSTRTMCSLQIKRAFKGGMSQIAYERKG